MSIDKPQVKKIAKLAKLKLSEDEVESYAGQCEKILQYVEKLNELDTSEVEPLAHVHDLTNVLREDEHTSQDDREKFLDNAPEHKGPYFKVPNVIGDK